MVYQLKNARLAKSYRDVEGSTCYGCYALKGCYVFKVVQEAQYRRLGSIKHPYWVRAMTHLLQSKKSKYFRWHDSGDVQDLKHLAKIFKVARLTPDVKHWMPTREAWVKPYLKYAPDNLVIRFSNADGGPTLQQRAGPIHFNCSYRQLVNVRVQLQIKAMLAESCRACWDKNVKNIAYGQH
jgi:hypothetical protein